MACMLLSPVTCNCKRELMLASLVLYVGFAGIEKCMTAAIYVIV